MEAALTRRVAVLALLAAPALSAEPPPKEAELWAKLVARIEAVDRGLDGVLGVSVRDIKTGAALDIRADERFPTASAIKPAILLELFHQAEAGRIDLLATTTPAAKRVGGGGVLQELGDRVTLTWRDLAVLMMAWSDNEATNLLIDKVGLEAVNRRLDALGLARTRLRRRMMDLEAARRGNENVSTPRELRRLMEAVDEGAGFSPARAADLRTLASVRKWEPPVPRAAPGRPAGARQGGRARGSPLRDRGRRPPGPALLRGRHDRRTSGGTTTGAKPSARSPPPSTRPSTGSPGRATSAASSARSSGS